MEVGAVKQAFNNEVILMKKNLNQAKIQIIHKLTRKAKTLTEKKVPEKLQGKFTKKAESAVKEVLIIKKIKAKDIAKFIVTHQGDLNSYLNKPDVDHDKACARLLLHKSLQSKYKSIRSRFSNTSIEDLSMSRLERRKLKKEAREKQKNKKKAKEAKRKAVNGESKWEVEEIDNDNTINVKGEEVETFDNEMQDDEEMANSIIAKSDDEVDNSKVVSESDDSSESEHKEIREDINVETIKNVQVENFVCKRSAGSNKNIAHSNLVNDKNVNNLPIKVAKEKKKKDLSKNKNFNEKILKRKFNKGVDEQPAQEVKIVDPFFITSTGENYMSVVEPRQPDEIKDVHKQGNRQYRRAVMFGHVPKPKPRKDGVKQSHRKFGDYSNSNNKDNSAPNNRYKRNNASKEEIEHVEKLHPSWAAKKKVSTLLPFEGRKTVFNDDE
ncbi:unnamed protein product, partial [Iphiclides podalirius]